MSYRFADSLRAGSGWNHPDPARKLSANTSFTTQVQLGQIQLELDHPEHNYCINLGVLYEKGSMRSAYL